MAVGLVIPVWLFANVYPLYVGPIPTNNPGLGDITFVVGFVITAVLYYVFNLGLRNQTAAAKTPTGSRAG